MERSKPQPQQRLPAAQVAMALGSAKAFIENQVKQQGYRRDLSKGPVDLDMALRNPHSFIHRLYLQMAALVLMARENIRYQNAISMTQEVLQHPGKLDDAVKRGSGMAFRPAAEFMGQQGKEKSASLKPLKHIMMTPEEETFLLGAQDTIAGLREQIQQFSQEIVRYSALALTHTNDVVTGIQDDTQAQTGRTLTVEETNEIYTNVQNAQNTNAMQDKIKFMGQASRVGTLESGSGVSEAPTLKPSHVKAMTQAEKFGQKAVKMGQQLETANMKLSGLQDSVRGVVKKVSQRSDYDFNALLGVLPQYLERGGIGPEPPAPPVE